jgi:hypothetical protein
MAAHNAFEIIPRCKAAIQAKGGRVLDVEYLNELDKCQNPRGDIGTLRFKVSTPYDYATELKVEHISLENTAFLGDTPRQVIPLASFEVKVK